MADDNKGNQEFEDSPEDEGEDEEKYSSGEEVESPTPSEEQSKYNLHDVAGASG